ncbi:MAG: hypothetical protein P4M15_04735 [Alphaproteobacteria bacterium]|nr:hypothetical protein [Alphaproteobacteria bacterium]
MTEGSKIELATLRKIGWDRWDPIGIRMFGDHAWRGPAADEYDTYLLHVAGMLKQAVPDEEAIAYLDWVASVHMGLGLRTAEGHAASVATVQAISEYLRERH